jgi:replicative DNA helicase
MSDGLKLISAILATGSGGTLAAIDREALLDNEVAAWDFTRQHLRQYRALPEAATVHAETGVRLPSAAEPLQYYVDQVWDRYEYNLIRDRFAEMREGLQRRQMTEVAECVSGMNRVLRRRRRGAHQAGEALNLSDAGRLVTERLAAIQGTGGISGIVTGWPRFDMITGGYQPGDLITWVGRMQTGKSYLLLYQALKAHEAGENVLFVTTEMSLEAMARRYAALKTGVNPTLLKNGNISTHMLRRIQSMFRDMMGHERFKFFAVGMNAKIDAIYALMQEFGPSIVFIDGVYLLRPTELSKNASRVDKVTAIYDELRAVTLESNIPAVVSTQFNRQAGKGGKEGSLENIGFSDAIGTHSSGVIAAKDGPGDNPKDGRTLDFLKGREGEAGQVVINFKFAPLDMSERDPDDEAEGDPSASVDWMGGGTPNRRRSDSPNVEDMETADVDS